MIYFSITLVRKRSRVQASSTAHESKRSQCVATSFFVAVRRVGPYGFCLYYTLCGVVPRRMGGEYLYAPACIYSDSAVWTAMSCVVTVYVWL